MVRLILQGKGTNNIQHLQEKMFKILTAEVKKKELHSRVALPRLYYLNIEDEKIILKYESKSWYYIFRVGCTLQHVNIVKETILHFSILDFKAISS